MSDSVLGLFCVACIDVCAGICLDFASLRHAFTENLCRCSCCCSRSRRSEDEDESESDSDSGEREPLIKGPPKQQEPMPPQPPMRL
ncbi:hypothetical protein C8F04DRAFT_511983 [Mycena alexandri]|uniref:Secreted protein n=1 Tax=Mycena alexandri TaxID=1745969 RepID=A0AAD6X4U6_9AGAR|nr:hypothetical protein C8F04DRAFT_511983 [Mycena alexandri]